MRLGVFMVFSAVFTCLEADAFQLKTPKHFIKCRNTLSVLRSNSHGDTEGGESNKLRRDILCNILTVPLLFCVSIPAVAAPPMTLGESDGLGARTERALRPKPPKILRPKLDQDFAVLLMRSSYNALDKIDCIAMDQFQRDFFLIRQAEYEPYVNALGPGIVQQGMLTDPYYFDFISFAQYATISREISQDPPFVFEEQQPVEVGEGQPQKFVSAVIKRDPSLKNDMLATEHSQLVGNAILDRLDETFGGTKSAIPSIPKSATNEEAQAAILASLTQIVKLFLVQGFAFDGSASISKPASSSGTVQFCMELSSPANLWSGKSLQVRRAQPRNDFLLKTSMAFLIRSGYAIESSSVKYDGTKETSYITLKL